MHSFIGPILQHNLLEKCEVDITFAFTYYILAEGISPGVYAAYVTYVRLVQHICLLLFLTRLHIFVVIGAIKSPTYL